jgi:TetR/AcrR family transcriptional regulator, transcriptional repressor for nem operon
MARPPEFDRDKALEAAMKLFWARGYTATSLSGLLQAMDISRSSFYASFGDKRSLYAECLALFAQRTRDMIVPCGPPVSASAIVKGFFEQSLFASPDYRVARGCMMVNTLLELAEVEPELQRAAQGALDMIRQKFEELFTEAHQRGEMAGSLAPKDLAEQVMTLNLGLRVQSRMDVDREQLRSTVNNNLTMFGLAA